LAAEILKVSPSVFKSGEELEAEQRQAEAQQAQQQELVQANAIAEQQNLISQSRRNESVAYLNEARAQRQ
jgi:hypothetical protein